MVDRSRLYGIHGQSRKGLLELAEKYGIKDPPAASAGCALTSPDFSKKVRDVFRHHPDYERWQFELLKIGRHFRLDRQTKVVISRNHTQNQYLETLHPPGTSLLTCHNFGGPHALLIGNPTEGNLQKAGQLMLRYAQKGGPEILEILWRREEKENIFTLDAIIQEPVLEKMRIV